MPGPEIILGLSAHLKIVRGPDIALAVDHQFATGVISAAREPQRHTHALGATRK